MITCPICGSQNDDLAVLCTSCKSYLQSKVDNLNLFETVWQLIESPGAAFKKIILARHKNYVFFLSALIGMSVAYTVFWMMRMGDHFGNLLLLTSSGVLLGIPLGLVFMLLVSTMIVSEIRLFRGKTGWKNAFAVASYSGVPVILSLVFVFPLEIAVFGVDFFGANPPPIVINPGVYLALITFDGLAALWSVLLFYRGARIVSGFGLAGSLVITVSVVLFVCVLLQGIGTLLGRIMLTPG